MFYNTFISLCFKTVLDNVTPNVFKIKPKQDIQNKFPDKKLSYYLPFNCNE